MYSGRKMKSLNLNLNSKIFLKYWHLDLLSEYILKLDENSVKIQKVVRGFIDRRRVKKLKQVVAKEAERILHFLSQVERLGQLVAKKEVMLDKIPINNMPSPASFKPLDNFDFPPPPNEFLTTQEEYLQILPDSKKKRNGNIEDDVDEESLEAEEDTFKPLPKYDPKQFGRVGTKNAAAKWFQETQIPKGAVESANGNPDVWFHGLISRREAERLLSNKPGGCFLIRVSESRFGYSLSFKTSNRCKHYFIEQTRSGKYVIVGFPKAFANLGQLISYHNKCPFNDMGDILTVPCGQESDIPDYNDLYEDLRIKSKKPKDKNVGFTPVADLPPPVPEKGGGIMPVDQLPPPLPVKSRKAHR